MSLRINIKQVLQQDRDFAPIHVIDCSCRLSLGTNKGIYNIGRVKFCKSDALFNLHSKSYSEEEAELGETLISKAEDSNILVYKLESQGIERLNYGDFLEITCFKFKSKSMSLKKIRPFGKYSMLLDLLLTKMKKLEEKKGASDEVTLNIEDNLMDPKTNTTLKVIFFK